MCLVSFTLKPGLETPSLAINGLSAPNVNEVGTRSDEGDGAETRSEDAVPGWMSRHGLVTRCLCLSLTKT